MTRILPIIILAALGYMNTPPPLSKHTPGVVMDGTKLNYYPPVEELPAPKGMGL